MVAPARERGLKSFAVVAFFATVGGRSREGAWIEIICSKIIMQCLVGRSREGAWIEI